LYFLGPKNRGAYYYYDYYCRLQRSRLLDSIIFVYNIIYTYILYKYEYNRRNIYNAYAIYTHIFYRKREIGVFDTFKSQIGSYVIYWFQLYIYYIYRLFSPQLYIFKSKYRLVCYISYKINENFCMSMETLHHCSVIFDSGNTFLYSYRFKYVIFNRENVINFIYIYL